MKKHTLRKHFRIAIFILIAFWAMSCKNQTNVDKAVIINGETGIHLDQVLIPFCKRIAADYDLPGLSVGIVKDNEIVYARGFGYLDNDSKEPVNISSLFHMASISKPFVATAIMQLVERNEINLDSALISYIPYFKLNGDQYDQITIRQMLNHISGMPDVTNYQWDNPVYDEGALERYVRSISSEEMIANPGKKFAYSNMAFECLGDVIAKVSGKSFAEYVKINILNPAGMKESTFLKPENLPDNWAAPHLRYIVSEPWDGYPYNRMHGPSSTLHSNIMEMCNWAIINMKHGTHKEGHILSPSSYDLLWKPWFKTNWEESVGLSWFLGEYKGESTVGHGGGDTGFSTNLVLLPEKSIAVIVLCNLNPAPVNKVTNAALDILLGYEPDNYKLPAIIPVSLELEQNGLDAAVKMWKSLEANNSGEYDFENQVFAGLYNAADMNREEEAVLLTKLYINIFDKEVLNTLMDEAKYFLKENPGNTAVRSALRLLEEII